ncbi:Uncharacterised protein [Yersinia frederiksenii]|uniref:Uncharacterized protein n=2 Tax=Yersinia frederiksenii TaxID=29484 RepID=A0A380PUK5_YERFR|nr:hypothetical protein [Yersinia frederiksenii]KGA45912.1 hypothetical protein DJ58_197 [Yersinia frederiksenii ATCC 33641]SUP77286.1 Uncharacterised protein [Yersinia frederiksenii]
MINFSEFNSNNAIEDNMVGIAFTEMFKKNGLRAYGTRVKQGKRVGCHSHVKGEEWYIIISGEGAIWTADVIAGTLKNKLSISSLKVLYFVYILIQCINLLQRRMLNLSFYVQSHIFLMTEFCLMILRTIWTEINFSGLNLKNIKKGEGTSPVNTQ